MIKNDIYKKFLQNPELIEITDLNENQICKMDLFSETNTMVLEVIKTAVLYTEDSSSVGLTARRINQLFKKGANGH